MERRITVDANDIFPWWGPLIWPIVALAGTAIQIGTTKTPKTALRKLEIFLVWWFAWGVGVTALAAFASILFAPDLIAHQIGYRITPFEFEVGSANLGIAALGFLCIRFRGQYWEATTVAATLFLWGAAIGHIYQFAANGNTQPYNIGPVLYTDILVQLILIITLIWFRRLQRSGQRIGTAEQDRVTASALE